MTDARIAYILADVEHGESDKQRTEIYRGMTPSQKLEQAFQLRELAWAVKAAGIRASHPELSEEAVQAEVRKIFLYAVS